jgi:hypothetical protein
MAAYSFYVAYRGQPPIAREAITKFLRNRSIPHLQCPERAKIVVFENTRAEKPSICRTMTYRLFYAPDNASLIVRLTLEELQQSYETTLVDRAVNGQNNSEYLKYNPGRQNPDIVG